MSEWQLKYSPFFCEILTKIGIKIRLHEKPCITNIHTLIDNIAEK